MCMYTLLQRVHQCVSRIIIMYTFCVWCVYISMTMTVCECVFLWKDLLLGFNFVQGADDDDVDDKSFI